MGKFTEDDFCDIYEKKICDNCGKCLEDDGVDIRAINIEEISKDIEENKFLEEEFIREVEDSSEDVEISNSKELLAAYEKLKSEFKDFDDEEYIDAFDHIEYIEDFDVNDDLMLEENTEEIFPGVRKLKSNPNRN